MNSEPLFEFSKFCTDSSIWDWDILSFPLHPSRDRFVVNFEVCNQGVQNFVQEYLTWNVVDFEHWLLLFCSTWHKDLCTLQHHTLTRQNLQNLATCQNCHNMSKFICWMSWSSNASHYNKCSDGACTSIHSLVTLLLQLSWWDCTCMFFYAQW